MKIGLVVTNQATQIMISPETDAEKSILDLLNEKNSVEIIRASYNSPYGQFPQLTEGGYLREFNKTGTVMLVVKKD